MNVLVDTDVWSEALRKKKGRKSAYVEEMVDLIQEGRIEMIGPIRMEILSGIKEQTVFDTFSERLAAFVDRPIPSEVYVLGARFLNLCRKKGIQGSNTDFLICACSVHWSIPILSKDKDYQHYKKHLPVELIQPRKENG
ncbi:MAG: PIN domain nuclease [Verrucomicrobiota bacterium]